MQRTGRAMRKIRFICNFKVPALGKYLHMKVDCCQPQPSPNESISTLLTTRFMKTDLQKAALQKLARLTHYDHLPPEQRGNFQDRVLRGCRLERKKLVNGVNGLNGVGTAHRILVFFALLMARRQFTADDT